jgi:hypothetical protein
MDIQRVVHAIHRLRPDWRDAAAFYELRSECTGELLRIMRRLDREAIGVAAMPPAVTAPVASPQRPVRRRSASGVRGRRHRYPLPPPHNGTASLL